MLCLKLLYEEKVVRDPNPILREKKDWVTAAYQTLGSYSFSHWGVKRKRIPSVLPGRLSPLTSRANITKYGKIAVKYAIFPELSTPFLSVNYPPCFLISTINHNTSFFSVFYEFIIFLLVYIEVHEKVKHKGCFYFVFSVLGNPEIKLSLQSNLNI